MVQLIINQNWFRQWLGTEKTLYISHYLSPGWLMVHIWVSRIDWVDYFTVLGKYIHAEKNGTVWAYEGCFHPHIHTEKTLYISHYLSPGWLMVHIWVSRIDWVDYFTVLGKYIHAEKNGTVWAYEGCFHPHIWKWAIPTRQVGSGRGTGRPFFVNSRLAAPATLNSSLDYR